MKSRLRIAWAVLRGYPAGYRLGFAQGGMTWDMQKKNRRAYFQECEFHHVRWPEGSRPGPGFRCIRHRLRLVENDGQWECPMDGEVVLVADLPMP